jgi:osmoprotectant transport system permease protein
MSRRSLWEQIVQQLEIRYAELGMAVLQHIKLVTVSMGIAVVIGVALGVAVSRYRRLEGPVIGTAGTLQTIPSLALLGFMIPFFGIGEVPSIIALFLYSLLPIIRNTHAGIVSVDQSVIEAASGMGMTETQILFRIQLPLAFPVMMAGIRTSTVINVGTATLAAFIGAGGLGEFIFLGISRSMDALVLIGAVPAALLALLLDFVLGRLQRLVTPKGLKR